MEETYEAKVEAKAAASPAPASQHRGWRFWAIMTSMALSSVLAGLDATAVSTALPSIIHDLGSSQGYVWIANSYLLTTTAFTPIVGQTANIFGRRTITLFSIITFTIGSAIAGPAPNLGALITGRAIQGIGCAGLNAMVEMVVCDMVPLRERGKFMSFIFAIYAVSTTIGPLVGGAFATFVTWRWVFYINLPLSGLTFGMVVVSLKALPKGSSLISKSAIKRIDFAGNALLVTSITSILIALTWGGQEFPWSSFRTIVPLVLGLVGLPLFLLYESKVPAEPTTPLRLFSNRTSLAGFWMAFIHNMLIFWVLFALPIYFQSTFRDSAFRSGVSILPTAAVFVPITIVSGVVMSKIGRYRPLLMVGFAFIPISIGLLTRLNAESTTGYWVGAQLIGSIGYGIITPVTLPTILTPLGEADVAVGTATWAFMRGFGTIWGAAIPLAIFNSRAQQLAAERLPGNEMVYTALSKGGAYSLAAGGSLYSALNLDDDPAFATVVKGIYDDSLKLSWQVALGFSLLGFLLTFLVRELHMRSELETEFGLIEPPTDKAGQAAVAEKMSDVST
ncbi:putative multidrug resistance protein fnx1 [Xylariaceae sp. FL0255]|nr:putative multidrug resistance protein fnx1 [Xylariaceae sp. FL0255]